MVITVKALVTSFKRLCLGIRFGIVFAAAIGNSQVFAADVDVKELAKQSQNPVAKLISVPIENDFNGDYGPDNSNQNVLQAKPVLPQSLGDNWNWIHRSIVPIISQPGISGGPNRQNGLGDSLYQGFLSPAHPGDLVWGVGPALQLPTHSDELLGNENWAAGPAAVLLTMPGHWVIGVVAWQVWDFAKSGNDGSEEDISAFTMQPFINYNYDGGWYLNTAPVIAANWEENGGDEWTVPLGGGVGRVFQIGEQHVNLKGSYYWNIEKPEFGAQWSLQLQFTLLFPK